MLARVFAMTDVWLFLTWVLTSRKRVRRLGHGWSSKICFLNQQPYFIVWSNNCSFSLILSLSFFLYFCVRVFLFLALWFYLIMIAIISNFMCISMDLKTECYTTENKHFKNNTGELFLQFLWNIYLEVPWVVTITWFLNWIREMKVIFFKICYWGRVCNVILSEIIL